MANPRPTPKPGPGSKDEDFLAFERVVEETLRPDLVAVTFSPPRAKAWNRHFQYARAIDDYAEAIRRAAADPAPRRALAWLLATCPNRAFRDSPRAVQEGTMACELTHWKSAECLDALSAAYAEAGDFSSAVKWQSQAVKLLPPGDKKLLRLYLARQAMYEFRHPYRD